jgi:plasmid stabilization system protein ParE
MFCGQSTRVRTSSQSTHTLRNEPIDPEIRVKIVQRYRYKIFYSIIDNSTIEIIHVRHASRRPWEGQK